MASAAMRETPTISFEYADGSARPTDTETMLPRPDFGRHLTDRRDLQKLVAAVKLVQEDASQQGDDWIAPKDGDRAPGRWLRAMVDAAERLEGSSLIACVAVLSKEKIAVHSDGQLSAYMSKLSRIGAARPGSNCLGRPVRDCDRGRTKCARRIPSLVVTLVVIKNESCVRVS